MIEIALENACIAYRIRGRTWKNFSLFPNSIRNKKRNFGETLEYSSNTAQNTPDNNATLSEDYSRALTSARIACYDDLASAPRITEIPPNTTTEFIEQLASTVYTQAQQAGGSIPYTAIREVSENFIHAQFREIIVSILDKGNTIRFSDQGPGIAQKEKAQMPGFSSATEPMKRYIRGVGSGLPLVKEYLSFKHGRITIEDNLKSGAVVTISVTPEDQKREPLPYENRKIIIPPLNDREKEVLFLFTRTHTLRLTDVKDELEISPSTTHRILSKLEEYGLIESTGKLRSLTDFGNRVARQLFS